MNYYQFGLIAVMAVEVVYFALSLSGINGRIKADLEGVK